MLSQSESRVDLAGLRDPFDMREFHEEVLKDGQVLLSMLKEKLTPGHRRVKIPERQSPLFAQEDVIK